ncbi:hypothetical protein ABPG75_008873 [Micractinium tetrahymenae]
MRPLLAGLLWAALFAAALGASTSTPGDLSPDETPMFVLFTHDDAVTSKTFDLMTSITDGKEANGCPLVATMFVLSHGTDCDLVNELHSRGYEIGDHTVHHKSLNDMGSSEIKKEIVGARSDITDCGIPESAIKGFRSPYLDTNPKVRQVLAEAGFEYDSSLIENTKGASVSNSFADRIWPFDMGDGIPINCHYYSPAQKCEDNESYTGLYEVPLWDLTAHGTYTMDPGKGNAYDVLVANFDEAYSGNRAPFPVFIHTPWLEKNRDDMEKFVDYARSQPGVYFVTIQQLLDWQRDPVPLSQLSDRLGCGIGGPSGDAESPSPSPEEESPEPSPSPEDENSEEESPEPSPSPDKEESPKSPPSPDEEESSERSPSPDSDVHQVSIEVSPEKH